MSIFRRLALVVPALLTAVQVDAAAAPPTAARIAAAVDRQSSKPSVHDEQPAIERALEAAAVPPAVVRRLFTAVNRADLPGMAARLDGFLFLTRDPEWRAMRRHFAEFLELPGITSLSAEDAKPLAGYGGVVTLPDVVSLDPATAAAATTFGEDDWGAAIELPAVKELDPEAARTLARCEALLVLPNLERLSVEAARGLAGHEGIGIVIGGLDRLPADVAAALAETKSLQGLLLPDLVTLDSQPLARRLSRQDHAFLPQVTRLEPAIATALRGSEGGELALPGLVEISPAVAEQLVGAGYYTLSLGGAASLTAETAAILARHPGELVFPGPAAFPAAAAAELAKHGHVISLPHVAMLPADVARALARHEGLLLLGGVTDLPAETAALLAEHPGGVVFPALESLAPAAAAALAVRSNSIDLSALRSLDVPTAEAFAAHARDTLAIGGLTEISPPVAAALAKFDGRLVLPALARLTPETARALAAHRGELKLESVSDISADTAGELARHEGGLDLNAVESLSTEAATALATVPGDLDLWNLLSLTPEGAAAFARRTEPLGLLGLQHTDRLDSVPLAELLVARFDDLELTNVQSLVGPRAAAIARALARCRGSLSLPALERISPAALEALLAKPGCHLPEGEQLELVPDAGVGGHDDFVDPRQ